MRRRLAYVLLLAVSLIGPPVAAPVRSTAARRAATAPGAPACPLFPATNVWNMNISKLPVASDSAVLLQSIGLTTGLHPDFGSDPTNGIPYNIVSGTQAKVTVAFDDADESDPVSYPIPVSPTIEAGSDRHMLIVDKDACVLYELFDARPMSSGWQAGSGAIWRLTSNALRPDGWTSADAAGLPILPGLARYDEVAAGVIAHALRFTAAHTHNSHIYPARHDAGVTNAAYPPMGVRVRLKAAVDISGFSPQARVILAALKTYGMILADNGSNWYISGAPDPRWNDDDLHHLNQMTGASFEVVDTRGLVNGPTASATPTVSPRSTATTPSVPPTALATAANTATARAIPMATAIRTTIHAPCRHTPSRRHMCQQRRRSLSVGKRR